MNLIKSDMTKDIVLHAHEGITNLRQTSPNGYLKTHDIRKLSSTLYKSLKTHDIDTMLSLSEALLKEKQWALKIIAFDFAHRVKNQYNAQTFSIFEHWLFTYVRDWSDCDDFCTHAFGELIIQHPHLFNQIISWTTHEDFWVRRAAPVVLILAIKRNAYHRFDLFKVSDLLMTDTHDLVRKGYGWMLKVLSQKEPDKVYHYLKTHKDIMPRVSFRYGLEKLELHKKLDLMKL